MSGASLLPVVAHVPQSIQLALAPAFLVSGIMGFLNVLSARLGRVVDRSRVLAPQVWTTHGAQHDEIVSELNVLDRRIHLLNRAILSSVSSASSLCLVIVLLFASTIVQLPLEPVVAAFFIAAMIALLIGFVLFTREIGLGSRLLRVPPDVLAHQDKGSD